jgi:hypothetical protein
MKPYNHKLNKRPDPKDVENYPKEMQTLIFGDKQEETKVDPYGLHEPIIKHRAKRSGERGKGRGTSNQLLEPTYAELLKKNEVAQKWLKDRKVVK